MMDEILVLRLLVGFGKIGILLVSDMGRRRKNWNEESSLHLVGDDDIELNYGQVLIWISIASVKDNNDILRRESYE